MPQNAQAVADYLKQRLECEVETEQFGEDADTRFEPQGEAFGELFLDDQLTSQTEEPAVLERLRRDGVDDLLRRGERVKVSRTATEILPGR